MKKAEGHHIDILEELLNEITPRERKRTENRMRLAAKIADAIEAKGWSKQKLAKELGYKSSSIVTKWLSGTNNFTCDVLSDIQDVLGVELLNTEEVAEVQATVYRLEYRVQSGAIHKQIANRQVDKEVSSMRVASLSINPWHGTQLKA